MHNAINDTVKSRFTLWLAHWNVSTPYCDCGIWQKSAKGKISGINGDVDIDFCTTDFTAIVKALGFNGFSKSETKAETEIKITVEINGKTYHGTLKE